jgi:ABC-type sugar transport system substrate-binding protein
MDSGCELYFILPDTPHYFWDALRKSVCTAEKQYRCKYNVYTKLHDDATATDYLREAKSLYAKVIIAALDGSSSVCSALAEASDGAMVILISEYADVKNAFYFGSDATRDGFLLGQYYMKTSPGILYVIAPEENRNCEKRLAGFTSGAGIDINELRIIKMPKADRLFAAKLAPSFAALPKDQTLCFYCVAGCTDGIRLAAIKAKIDARTTLLCHDPSNTSLLNTRRGGKIIACIHQNVALQGKTALEAAEKFINEGIYPEKKFNYIPSELEILH